MVSSDEGCLVFAIEARQLLTSGLSSTFIEMRRDELNPPTHYSAHPLAHMTIVVCRPNKRETSVVGIESNKPSQNIFICQLRQERRAELRNKVGASDPDKRRYPCHIEHGTPLDATKSGGPTPFGNGKWSPKLLDVLGMNAQRAVRGFDGVRVNSTERAASA